MISEDERIIVDVLRQIVSEHLQGYGQEKISFGVPFFYGKKGICIIWPASVPRGGISKGVLLGFWYGNLLQDPLKYLDRGSNKKVYYKIYERIEDIDIPKISALLNEAIQLDKLWN